MFPLLILSHYFPKLRIRLKTSCHSRDFCCAVFPAAVSGTPYHIYHHCYQEGGRCGVKDISCGTDAVIQVVWSRIGFSEYWLLDPFHNNCSVTNETCYQTTDEPQRNCSGLSRCELNTCSASTWQPLPCSDIGMSNYMRINYTCIGKARVIPVLIITAVISVITML